MAEAEPCPDPDLDRISDLPDCLLLTILSYLPHKDSARTAILSPRWRHLWTFSSLNIHGRFPNPNPNHRKRKRSTSDQEDDDASTSSAGAVSKILSRHRGPIRSFLFSDREWACFVKSRRSHEVLPPYKDWARFATTVGSWMATLADRGIQHLNLRYVIPPCILRCRSLHSLELIDFKFSNPPSIPANLRELKLAKVKLTDGVLSRILDELRFLDTLELHDCRDLTKICISSEILRKFRLKLSSEKRFWWTAKALVVDAPNLEILMLAESIVRRLPVKVINSPKLQLVGVVNAKANALQIGEPEVPINLHACMQSIKEIAIKVNFCKFLQGKYVAACLKCFPCLETLNLLIDNTAVDAPRAWNWEHEEGSSDCLEHHLKVVKLIGTVGHKYDRGFAKFLLQNAQVLKVMSLHCVYRKTAAWREPRLRELCCEKKASLNAQVIIIKDDHPDDEYSTWEGLFSFS